jgi:hypothetical protein
MIGSKLYGYSNHISISKIFGLVRRATPKHLRGTIKMANIFKIKDKKNNVAFEPFER